MTAPAAMYGYILCIACFASAGACDRADRAVPVRVVDLIDEFERAEQRPAPGLRVPAHTIAGARHPAIVMSVPSRVTFNLPLPRRGLLRTFAAVTGPTSGSAGVPTRLRIGIADDRIYEGLHELTVTPVQGEWIELHADLSAYAGWKWSLFYRPDRIVWRLVLAADALRAGEGNVAWGAPEIVTDRKAVREYLERRSQLLQHEMAEKCSRGTGALGRLSP